MKKNLLFRWGIVLLLVPSAMKAQQLSTQAFVSSDTVPATYLGIDFTLAKLIHDDASVASTIQSTQFNGINDLIIKEYKKYDVQDAFHRKNWTNDLTEVEARNSKADPTKLMSSNDGDLNRLKNSDIESLVAGFNYGSHNGYGVLLVMEGMDKTKKVCTIWFTLVDMQAKKVLITQQVEGKLGSGFGFRNYWASAIKNAISQFKSKDYDTWK